MRTAVRDLWGARAPRERLVIAVLVALLAAVLYVSFVQSASRARTQLEKSVSQLRTEAARMTRSSDEIVRLRASPPPSSPASAQDFRALMQARIDSAGLGASLRSIEPLDAGQVRVTFGAVPFGDWVAWVEELQTQQIRLDTTRIEALASPGMVGVTATFVRPRP